MVGYEVMWGDLLWLVATWLSFDVVVTSFDAM